eukprot:3892965-Prymnesium_polylepis.2
MRAHNEERLTRRPDGQQPSRIQVAVLFIGSKEQPTHPRAHAADLSASCAVTSMPGATFALLALAIFRWRRRSARPPPMCHGR